MNASTAALFFGAVPCPVCYQAEDLATVTSYELFVAAGFDAVIGHPLPNGKIPVAAANLGTVQATRDDVAGYLALCDAERRARPVPHQ